MIDQNERFQSHLADAIRIVRMRHLLEIILPFAPNVMTVNCHEQLVHWIAERAGWVVALDTSLERLERCRGFVPAEHGWVPANADLFHGTLAEYVESPDAWDWRLGFDLIVADDVIVGAVDPELELERTRGWAQWILATAPAGAGKAFLELFEKVIVSEDDGDSVIVLGR